MKQSPSAKRHQESTFNRRHSRIWLLLRVMTVAVIMALTIFSQGALPSVRAAGPPTVNGLFFGDGDDSLYIPYATSEYGSILYIYFDNPTLYVALVVDRSVNDNVFSPASNKAYTQSAGMNPPRDAKRLYDSEFASFTFECETVPLSWTWQMGYAGKPGATWIADHTVGGGLGTPPPGIVSASSLSWNMNTYEAKPYPTGVPWNMYVFGTTNDLWKSPFDPANPDTVPGLDGYPPTGPIGYSTVYEWEWPMVYEWSLDLAAAGCGGNPLFLVTGQSHHSPSKVSDENDDFPPLTPSPFYDFGDLPDSYGTLDASGGPAHVITVDGARLGAVAPDIEPDGQPGTFATGDDALGTLDEDGMTVNTTPRWQNGNTVSVNLDVQGTTPTGTADIGMWIDWNGDGDFGDAGEFYLYLDRPTGVVATESFVVPGASIYTVGDTLNVRVRIFNDEADAPGGSLDATDYLGAATSGEIEDHQFYFGPTAISLLTLSDSDLRPSSVAAILLLMAAMAVVTALLVLKHSRVRRSQRHAEF
jgi:hypothetical protein